MPGGAVLLNVPEKTVLAIARERQISNLNMLGQRKFKCDNVNSWIAEQMAAEIGNVEKSAADV